MCFVLTTATHLSNHDLSQTQFDSFRDPSSPIDRSIAFLPPARSPHITNTMDESSPPRAIDIDTDADLMPMPTPIPTAASSTSTTPEPTATKDVELLDGENGNAQSSSKKKSPKVEESKSKKEHVNVVFIGHVGECFFVCAYVVRVSGTRSVRSSICPRWLVHLWFRIVGESTS